MHSRVWHIQGMLASFKKASFTINSIPIRVLLVVLIELIHIRDTTPLSLFQASFFMVNAVTTFALALILTLLVEAPSMGLEKVMFKRKRD